MITLGVGVFPFRDIDDYIRSCRAVLCPMFTKVSPEIEESMKRKLKVCTADALPRICARRRIHRALSRGETHGRSRLLEELEGSAAAAQTKGGVPTLNRSVFGSELIKTNARKKRKDDSLIIVQDGCCKNEKSTAEPGDKVVVTNFGTSAADHQKDCGNEVGLSNVEIRVESGDLSSLAEWEQAKEALGRDLTFVRAEPTVTYNVKNPPTF